MEGVGKLIDETTGFRLRKAWRVTVKDYDDSGIVFAPTAGRARANVLSSFDHSDVRIVDIVARREVESDVLLPQPAPVASLLSKEERHCLLHAFGANENDPTKAGYREHFYTYRDDPPLVSLTKRGLMKPSTGETRMAYFILTQRGKHVALSLVPEYRA